MSRQNNHIDNMLRAGVKFRRRPVGLLSNIYEPNPRPLLKAGEKVIIDNDYNNSSIVEIISVSPNLMFAVVKSEDGTEWETSTYRLTTV